MTTVLVSPKQKREKTEYVLKNIYNLPSLPKLLQEVLKLLDKKEISNSDLSNIISNDQGIVSRILTISNSPMYGMQRRVSSIDFALLVLGFSELKNIISVLSFTEAFRDKSDKYLDQKEFWLHSLLTGCAAKKLADDFGYYNSGEAFIGGFLHDMGINVIHKYFPSALEEITKHINISGLNRCEAEEEVLGMNHKEIGYYLSQKWNYPDVLSDSILHHHKPSESEANDKILPAIIHFADYMTIKLELGNIYYDKDLVLDMDSLSELKFKNNDEIDQFIEGYRELFINQIESIRHLS